MANSITSHLRADNNLRLENWDSYGAAPLTDIALNTADLLHSRWIAMPTNDGGVQLELHTHGIDLEIEIGPDGKVKIEDIG